MAFPTNKPTFKTIKKTVAAAGSAEQLPNCPVPDGHSLVIKAPSSNTGVIEVGESEAIAEGSSPFPLAAGELVTLQVTNANCVWIDATVNGEGICGIVEAQ